MCQIRMSVRLIRCIVIAVIMSFSQSFLPRCCQESQLCWGQIWRWEIRLLLETTTQINFCTSQGSILFKEVLMNPFSVFEAWKIANPFQPSSNGTIYLRKQSRNRRSIIVCTLIDLLEAQWWIHVSKMTGSTASSMLYLVVDGILERKNGLPKNIFSQM